MRTLRLLPFVVLAALGTVDPLAGQVVVAPPMLFLGDGERVGSFYVTNGSETSQEVVIGFRFGYPVSDSAGTLRMEYADSAAAERFGMTSWVRAFPKRFVLPAGEQQVVRMVASPPPGLPERTYWTRVVTTSTPRAELVDTLAEGVSARVVFRLEQITTVLYTRGAVETGVALGVPAARADASVVVDVPLARRGGAPFFGTVEVAVRDASGAVVGRTSVATAVYFDLLEREVVELDGALAPGRYTVDVTVRAGRPDIGAEHVPVLEPVTATAVFTVP